MKILRALHAAHALNPELSYFLLRGYLKIRHPGEKHLYAPQTYSIHKSDSCHDQLIGYSLADLTPDFNHRLNLGATMKQCFFILSILGYSCFASAGGDLAGSEFSGLDKFNKSYDMIAITGQQGNGNTASINQSGAHIYGSISQLGGHNYAALSQSGFNNRADIAQYGDGNSATVNQTGMNNSATLVQVGTGNQSDINQTGFENYAEIVNKGKGNLTQINQTGTNRGAAVVQNSAGMAIRITQN